MTEKIFAIVEEAITDLNEELEYDSLNNVSNDTPVYSGDDSIDSLALVRLVSVLESEVSEAFGKKVTIADEKLTSEESTPFKTVETIVAYIASRIESA